MKSIKIRVKPASEVGQKSEAYKAYKAMRKKQSETVEKYRQQGRESEAIYLCKVFSLGKSEMPNC
jgi:hypothetical protein